MVINMKKIILFSTFIIPFVASCSYKPNVASVDKLQKVFNDKAVSETKIDYPSHDPSILNGQKVYNANCTKCHMDTPIVTEKSIAFFRSRSPAEQFATVNDGGWIKGHAYRDRLTQDEIWDVLMYFRTAVLGYYKTGSAELQEMDAIFGGNCAVCHGTRGQGDGNLHKSLNPPPANFKSFSRLYTRSDNKLFDEITNGIPWTAMPAWKDRYDFDKHVSFDDEMRWRLVRYVRQFAFSQDKDRLELGREKLEAEVKKDRE